MDGIIDQLRLTEGVEVAIFMYQTGPQEFKVSLRSRECGRCKQGSQSYFGGGGHVRAAGCSMSGRMRMPSVEQICRSASGRAVRVQPALRRSMMYHGIINVYKEPGFTHRHDVVARLRRDLKDQKEMGQHRERWIRRQKVCFRYV